MGHGVKPRGESIAISFQYRGMQCRETIKLPPTKENLRYAANLRAEIERKIAISAFNYADYFPESRTKAAKLFGNATHTQTVKQAIERYLASMSRTLAPSTFKEYSSSVRIIIEGIGEYNVAKISTAIVREWINSLDCSNKRINNILVPLRGMFKDLFADGIIDRDPMVRIKNLPISSQEPEPFSGSELEVIINAMPPAGANLVQFAAWTGLRSGELYALTWEDIDWHNKTCRVSKTLTGGELKNSTKTYNARDVELLPAAIDALTKQKAISFLAGSHVWVHPRTGKPFTSDKQFREQIWQGVLKKAGIRYRPPYQLRHTYASTLLSSGANPMWVAKQMGHADWGMIRKIYGRWIPQEMSEAERMAVVLGQKSDSDSNNLTQERNRIA